MEKELQKNYDFLFIDKLDAPFKVEPDDILDNKKYLEVIEKNEIIHVENKKIADRCDKLKEEMNKIRDITDKIKEKINNENTS